MTSLQATARAGAPIADVDRRLFGGFVEHLGRHIYNGIHEPGHPSAGTDGLRTDVIELVRELGVTTVRYPGGNFVSGYRWEDGIGPRESRPRRLDLAWHVTETNQVGLHEFAGWLDKVGAELMLALNLGTRGLGSALELLEYANLPVGTARADQRAANGHPAPFGVRMWCLGNELDGPWQLGHRSADEYGRLAAQVARGMRMLDPDVQLVVCGSSGRGMPTFGDWERTVLGHTYDLVDYVSCHSYYQEHDGDAQEFLASAVDMALFIEEVARICDEVATTRESGRRLDISFDEWNVWYQHTPGSEPGPRALDDWPVAPRQLENIYSVLDAVVVGDLLITLLQHSDRVRSASLAQLVNVIAPIMTEPGGPAWRQTTFHPFSLTSRLARPRAVRLEVDCPTFASNRFGEVPVLNAVATVGDAGTTLFVVNRSATADLELDLDLTGLVNGTPVIAEAHTLADADLYAANTLSDPLRVAPVPAAVTVIRGDGSCILHVQLPRVSWTAIRLT